MTDGQPSTFRLDSVHGRYHGARLRDTTDHQKPYFMELSEVAIQRFIDFFSDLIGYVLEKCGLVALSIHAIGARALVARFVCSFLLLTPRLAAQGPSVQGR